LNLAHNNSITKLSLLNNLKKLQHLNLLRCCRIEDLETLQELTSLTHLNLSGVFVLDEITYPNLNFAKSLINLEFLDISNNPMICFIEPLAILPRLKILNISVCRSIKDLDALESYPSLELITISKKAFRKLPTLEKVMINFS
ncbi:hypothetical protein RZS08_08050, partial [Arthrospira platensis SPKY1]|nr:hypothetical protein [Arthrospira platensis SPKY1]